KMAIYLNNGATTWPKPECVPQAMYDFLTSGGANLARGSASGRDIGTLDMVTTAREKLAAFFCGHGGGDSRYVTFTANVTEALNVVLKGYLRKGHHAVTTSMEHNAVIRPLRRLEEEGVRLSILPCSASGELDPADLEDFLRKETVHLVVISHASNVCGTIQPLEEVSRICSNNGVPLVLDAAQTGGVLDIDAKRLNLAALCFTGHKGLLGPQGIGGILWEPAFAEKVAPFVEGGTGSFSDSERQPKTMPDKFEAGTPNLPGIAGLSSALDWIDKTGRDRIRRREEALGARLLEGLRGMEKLTTYGKDTMAGRLAVFALNPPDGDNGTLAMRLADEWGIETRPGLHCAPLAHKTLGSFPQGALRISIGYFNTEEEIESVLKALESFL
ncbi:MAG: aminotransferase class V-fold PLP-dependent enzyme, partial [Thermovirgaceae bacterium]